MVLAGGSLAVVLLLRPVRPDLDAADVRPGMTLDEFETIIGTAEADTALVAPLVARFAKHTPVPPNAVTRAWIGERVAVVALFGPDGRAETIAHLGLEVREPLLDKLRRWLGL